MTAEHLEVTYDAAMASLDGGQRWAVEQYVAAAGGGVVFGPATTRKRLMAGFRREAATITAEMKKNDGP